MLKIELGEKMEKICNEAAPECFGLGADLQKCETCIYRESCQFCVEDAKRMKIQDSKWYHYSEYIDNCSPSTENILPVDISDNRTYTRDEVIALSAFLLRIGKDRKLGKILSAKLMGAKSFAEIARCEGVTRQAIHKRVGKQLAKLLGYKNRQLTDSRLLTLTKDEFQLLKLVRADADDEDIMELMHLSKNDLRERKKTLDYKISKWT